MKLNNNDNYSYSNGINITLPPKKKIEKKNLIVFFPELKTHPPRVVKFGSSTICSGS